MDLPDRAIALAGDWHGDRGWVQRVFASLHGLDIRTLLHAGDFGPLPYDPTWLPLIDELAETAGVERILVTAGNHEPWDRLTPLLAAGEPAKVSERVWFLPRPCRLSVGGRRVLSLGGAASVNRHHLAEGATWFAEEAITDEHVAAAIAGGPADLLITHETPARTPVRVVADQLRMHGWPKEALAASKVSREQVAAVWDAVRPELLVHGHMHLPGGGRTMDGRRVTSLGANRQHGNLMTLDMDTLTGDAVIVTEKARTA